MPAASAVATVSQVVMDSNATTTIISNINSLYNNIFTFVAVLVTLGGIAFPIALTRYQNKKIKNNQNQLTELIKSEIAAAKAALVGDIKKELASDIEKLEKNISDIKTELNESIHEKTAGLNAKAHHLQANTSIKENNFIGAFTDCATSIVDYATAKDEANLIKVLDVILINRVFPKLKKEDFEKNDEMDKWYEKVITVIEELNQSGRYTKELKSLKSKHKEAISR